MPVCDPSLQSRDPNHVELIEVAGKDRQELGALEEWKIGVLSEFKDPLIEGQPRQFAIDESILW